MKPEIIHCLVLALSISALCPNSAQAEDRLWMHGKINGQAVRMVFDTGASGPVLFKISAERLGVKFIPAPAQSPASTGEVAVGLTEGCEFDFSGEIYKMRFGILDLPEVVASRDVGDGILGWGVLANHIILIDAGRSNVTAFTKLPENANAWMQFRVQTNQDVLSIEIPDNGRTNTVLIDSGYDAGVCLAPDEWKVWKDEHKTKPLTLNAAYTPAAGMVVNEQAWGDKISFGSLILTDVPISEAQASEIHSPSCKAIFGMAALMRLRFIIDGANGIAYVNTSSQPPIPHQHNRLGAVFVPDDWRKDDDLTAHVAKGSPAQKAGIQDGDILLKIGDMDVTKWRTDPTVLPLSRFWTEPKGTVYHLTLLRRQQTNVVRVKLENILGPKTP